MVYEFDAFRISLLSLGTILARRKTLRRSGGRESLQSRRSDITTGTQREGRIVMLSLLSKGRNRRGEKKNMTKGWEGKLVTRESKKAFNESETKQPLLREKRRCRDGIRRKKGRGAKSIGGAFEAEDRGLGRSGKPFLFYYHARVRDNRWTKGKRLGKNAAKGVRLLRHEELKRRLTMSSCMICRKRETET